MPSRRVLVVEDNIDTARSLVHLLRIEGHEVQYAINGYAAITLAREFLPDVVVLDLGLPGLDGYEVCRRLRTDLRFADTRFIVVSGYSKDEDKRRSQAVGCEIHLAKPADPVQLLALVAG